MVRVQTTFNCADGMSPDVAARLVQLAERYRSNLRLECDGRRMQMDSLISILSVACRRGMPLAVIADGEDEQAAAEALSAALAG